MKKLWQAHRENIVSFCAIVSTMVGITSLCLKLAELKAQPQSGTAIRSEIQAKEENSVGYFNLSKVVESIDNKGFD